MTTRVTFLCHGPDAIRITPQYGVVDATPNSSESFVLQPGQFREDKYVYAGLSFKVEEVVRS